MNAKRQPHAGANNSVSRKNTAAAAPAAAPTQKLPFTARSTRPRKRAGMAAGVSHTLGGIVYKTFAAPQSKVQNATIAALRKMQIKVTERKRDENKALITARATDRDIDIEIEALTPNATRITVVAKKDGGLIRDSATATEIILQTEKYVGTG